MNGRMNGADVRFSSVSIDTRNIVPGDLFIAIKGENFDANDFVADAERLGAAAVVVQRNVAIQLSNVVVGDTRHALGQLAAEWRKRSRVPVVGITGSNGKTTVKEMVAAVLNEIDNVLFTRDNLNNEIGVPLTLLKLQDQNNYAVIEMGANHAGEIAYTSGLAVPDVAVITNAGAAHLEGFGSLEGVARAKGELITGLSDNGVAVLNADDKFIEIWRAMAAAKRVITFGLTDDADIGASDIQFVWTNAGFKNRFMLNYGQTSGEIYLNLAGRHNVYNALAASAACFALGVEFEDIRTGLLKLDSVPGRMQPIMGLGGALLIDDTYNANPTSFDAAIRVLSELKGQRHVILGAFAELGESSADLHADVGRQAKIAGVKSLYATGLDAIKAVEAFGQGGLYFESQDELIRQSKSLLQDDAIVLVKGSRSQHMERVIDALRAGKKT